MKVGYGDFVKLCRVDDGEEWCGWLSVCKDGVYVKEPPPGQYDERAILAEHPTGNLAEPVIRFPCALGDLREGLEQLGVYGCIDAFDMAEWVKNKGNSNDTPISASRAHVSDKLAKMNQASTKFWGNADRDDRGTHPNNVTVAAWLEQQGFSATLADKAATIIRPEWAPTGRKPEE